MLSRKEETILTAFARDDLERLADLHDAFVESGAAMPLRKLVHQGYMPVPKVKRDRSARELDRLTQLGAPKVLLEVHQYQSDPKGHVISRIEQGDTTLTFDELTTFIRKRRLVTWHSGILWGLEPTRRRRVERALMGSTVCTVRARRRLLHWRETLAPEIQKDAQERLGSHWNWNWHGPEGVREAAGFFAGLPSPLATEVHASECPEYRSRMMLMHGRPEQGASQVFGAARSPWPEDPRPAAARALTLLKRKLPQLIRFVETAASKGWEVHSFPRDY